MENIWLHWTPGVATDVLGNLLAQLPSLIGRPVRLGHRFELSTAEYQEPRTQYRAATLLTRLCPQKPPGDLLLALTEADLNALGITYVFGEADPAAGGAILSLYRFGHTPDHQSPPRQLLLRRTLTEAVHETGHLLGLDHCDDECCAMFLSTTVEETDRKEPRICDACRGKARLNS